MEMWALVAAVVVVCGAVGVEADATVLQSIMKKMEEGDFPLGLMKQGDEYGDDYFEENNKIEGSGLLPTFVAMGSLLVAGFFVTAFVLCDDDKDYKESDETVVVAPGEAPRWRAAHSATPSA